MAALAIMILVVSGLATGSTRHEVYRTNSGRTYGRIGKIVKFYTEYLLKAGNVILCIAFYASCFIYFSVRYIHHHHLPVARLLAYNVWVQCGHAPILQHLLGSLRYARNSTMAR